MMIHEQIQQMFNEDSDDDDEFFGFESILLILVHLICGFDSRGFIGSKNRCILYSNATYMRVCTVMMKDYYLSK